MFHPFFVQRAKLATRLSLRRSGCTSQQLDDVLSDFNRDTVSAGAVMAGVDVPSFNEVGIFDGSLIQRIVAFFESPEGRALIAAIVKILLALVVAI